jgi:hypothetical protein
MKIFQPLKFRTKIIEEKAIKGFTTSKLPFRFYSLKSFIIYTDTSAYEILKVYNLNFEVTLDALQKSEITYLGDEEFVKGFWKRKFKFLS